MQNIYEQVWRHTLEGPGFYLHNLGPLDSHALRREMLNLKTQQFSAFNIVSLTRFDQQRTTKFHQDGAPPHSILVLGYEPSPIKSRLFIADHACAANDLQIPVGPFIGELMLGRGEERLTNYVSELVQPDNAFILVINNSSDLGVLHKAEIINPNKDQLRIVNSMLLTLDDCQTRSEEEITNFIETESIAVRIDDTQVSY